MSIKLTASAAKQIQFHLNNRSGQLGLRFGVRDSGCSGYAYIVELTDAVATNDEVFESHGIKVIVDDKSLPLVDGTQIDYSRDGLSDTFIFSNPNVTASCGCGESFTTQKH